MPFWKQACGTLLMATTFMVGIVVVMAIGSFRVDSCTVRIAACDPQVEIAVDADPASDPQNAELAEIYRAALGRSFSDVVVSAVTTASNGIPPAIWDDDEIRGADADTVANFGKVRKTESSLREILANEPGIRFWTDDESNRAFRDGLGEAWANLHKKGIKGIVSFSNVGFNDKHDQAVLYFAYTCGGLCGEGEYVNLAKGANGWHVVSRAGLWVS